MAASRRRSAKARSETGIRIIGGRWRGRRLAVPDRPGLRPTADRIRETLFNWLQAVVPGARCLDLFAGSGALGLEALSRGASAVTFIDSDRVAIERLRAVIDNLGAADLADCRCQRAEDFIAAENRTFDLIFLDPPFNGNDLVRNCQKLAALCHADTLIYVESNQRNLPALLPESWTCHRTGRGGAVHFALYRPFVAPE